MILEEDAGSVLFLREAEPAAVGVQARVLRAEGIGRKAQCGGRGLDFGVAHTYIAGLAAARPAAQALEGRAQTVRSTTEGS